MNYHGTRKIWLFEQIHRAFSNKTWLDGIGEQINSLDLSSALAISINPLQIYFFPFKVLVTNHTSKCYGIMTNNLLCQSVT